MSELPRTRNVTVHIFDNDTRQELVAGETVTWAE
jgi:hypothetical protein